MSFKVMQIEVSNECSLECVYCPHPEQMRPKGNMTFETFRKCIELVKLSDNPEKSGRKWLWLNHFGEPMLNPLLPEFISYADSSNIEVSFATNGVDYEERLFPRSLWKKLADAGLKSVMLSAHVKTVEQMSKQIEGIVEINSLWLPKKEHMHDWAGQVSITGSDKYKLNLKTPCDYQVHNMFAVTWDGRIASCCYDMEGLVGLSVDDVLRDGFEFRKVALCNNCTLGHGDVAWLSDQLGRFPSNL